MQTHAAKIIHITIDRDWRVDVVLDLVGAKAGVDIRARAIRVTNLRAEQRERAHDKPVVAAFAEQRQRTLVAENQELVITLTTINNVVTNFSKDIIVEL